MMGPIMKMGFSHLFLYPNTIDGAVTLSAKCFASLLRLSIERHCSRVCKKLNEGYYEEDKKVCTNELIRAYELRRTLPRF